MKTFRRSQRTTETAVTARGVGMAASGITLTALGIGTASPPLVLVGATAALATAVSVAWLIMGATVTRRVLTSVRRDIEPGGIAVGDEAQVTVTIDSPGPLLQNLSLREQAAAELTGGTGTRAGVHRGPDAIRLRYGLTPTQRGRWSVGPALIRVSDPLGMAWTERAVGDITQVPVWPRVTDLAQSAGRLMGAAEHAARGARTPAPDDAALRDYRDGDDLRRVHWPSSARRGTLVVRSEEQSGRSAATVLIALPHEPGSLEWCVATGASIALSVLAAGHPVRMVADGAVSVDDGRAREGGGARATLLDATVDLMPAASPLATDTQLAQDVSRLGQAERDVVIAVLEPLGGAGLAALEPLGAGGRAWALISTSLGERAAAERTADRLVAAGWTAVTVDRGEDLETAWERMLSTGGAQ